MKSDFLIAVTQLAAERHLPREAVISAIEAALASAYKKDNMLAGQEISVSLNPANGELKLFTHKVAVESVEDSQREISISEAKKIQKSTALGETVAVESDIQGTGRIAAQIAKQVVLQRLREAERELVYEEFIEKEGEIATGTIQRMDPRSITLDLGRTEAILPVSEQVITERYRPGQKCKVHISEVRRSINGPEIVVSRSSKDLLQRLFEVEVPEILNGIVEIKAVAREAGSRSKVAVHSSQHRVDPVGSCVGLRGIRIQNIVNELQGEKIDVVQWDSDLQVFLANALSPCPVTRVELNANEESAVVIVPDHQLSLAIGREGQNARLCAKLSGLMVNIKGVTQAEEERLLRGDHPAGTMDTDADSSELTTTIDEDVSVESVESEMKDQEVAVVLQSDDLLSIEEQLAEATLEVDQISANADEQIEEIGLADIAETVWTTPAVAQQPQTIRFAEDILGSRTNAPSAGRGRGRQNKSTRASEELTPKSSKRNRRVEYDIDDDVEDDQLI